MNEIKVKIFCCKWNVSIEEGVKTSLKGQVFHNDIATSLRDLASDLRQTANDENLGSTLNRFNGFYSWIEESAQCVRAAVDHIRSHPLFYANFEGGFYLSDSADWVRQQVGDKEMGRTACEEFRLAGYVTGSDTLYPNVKQIQAGELLVATPGKQTVAVVTRRYYRFTHTESQNIKEDELYKAMHASALASMRRLVKYAAGRQIVVPLSGGYDSRLIVTLLRVLGCQNVFTFTYGVPGNAESLYSKRVADALGYPWHFEEYDEAMWREVWGANDRWRYQAMACNLSSVPHMQDWLAVRLMVQKKILENDCVFAPGHSGDFLAGSHIPNLAYSNKNFSMADVTKSLFGKHYALVPLKYISTSKEAWLMRIEDRIYGRDIYNASEFADAFEGWDWQERQAKFICNAVRVYEFFGFNWWMPLWDKSFVRFWEGVPLCLREQRKWYNQYVNDQFELVGNIRPESNFGNASDPGCIRKVIILSMRKCPPLKAVFVCLYKGILSVYNRMKVIRKKQNHHLDWYGWIERKRLLKGLRRGYGINSFVAEDVVGELLKRTDRK